MMAELQMDLRGGQHGWIAAKRERIGDGKAGVFPGTADDGESWSTIWGSGGRSGRAFLLRAGIVTR